MASLGRRIGTGCTMVFMGLSAYAGCSGDDNAGEGGGGKSGGAGVSAGGSSASPGSGGGAADASVGGSSGSGGSAGCPAYFANCGGKCIFTGNDPKNCGGC